MVGQRSKTSDAAAATGCYDAPNESNNDGLMSRDALNVFMSNIIVSSFDFFFF